MLSDEYVQLPCSLLINSYSYSYSYSYLVLLLLLLLLLLLSLSLSLFYSNISNQVIIEGFKPHDEPKLAVDDISFSIEQCETISSKYNGGVTVMEPLRSCFDFFF